MRSVLLGQALYVIFKWHFFSKIEKKSMNQTFRFKSVKRVLFVELRESFIENFKQRHSERKRKRPRLILVKET